MSSDQEVSVKFSAEVKGLLEGLKQAQDSTKAATEGMSGDLKGMIEAVEHLGFAAIGIGALGLAFEAVKTAIEFIPECIEKTNELAEEAKGLAITAGMSVNEFNDMATVFQISGAKAEDLTSIVQGMQRGIRANSQTLIDNGVAASQAALKHMTLAEYISAVVEKMNTYGDATDRDQLLMAAFGRGGMAFAASLVEVNERMKEGIALSQENAVLTNQAIEDQKELAHVKGELAHQEAIDAAMVAHATIQADIDFQRFKLDTIQGANDMVKAQQMLDDGWIEYQGKIEESRVGHGAMARSIVSDWEKMTAAAKVANKQYNDDIETMTRLNKESSAYIQKHPETAGDVGATKEDMKPAAKFKPAGTDTAAAASVSASEEKAKAALWAVEETRKAEEQLYKEEKISYAEMVELEKADAAQSLQISTNKWNAEAAALKDQPAELQKVLNAKADDERKYTSTINDLNAKTAQYDIDLNKASAQVLATIEEGNAKQDAEILKLKTTDQMNASKMILAEEQSRLDQEVALGKITVQEEIAQRRQLLAQETALDHQALEEQLATANLSATKRMEIENQIMALHRKNALEDQKLLDKSVLDSTQKWKTFTQGLTSGFSSSIQGLIHGTESWGDAFKNVCNSALDSIINMLVEWGTEELAQIAKGLVAHTAASSAKVGQNAAVAGTAAMGSAAEDGPYGWIIAIGAGLAVFAAAKSMGSAAGGWADVPSDQVAMIHKNEMVLPAYIAAPLRNALAGGGSIGGGPGGSGGGDTYYISALDARSFQQFLSRNTGALLGTLGSAMRNGRRS